MSRDRASPMRNALRASRVMNANNLVVSASSLSTELAVELGPSPRACGGWRDPAIPGRRVVAAAGAATRGRCESGVPPRTGMPAAGGGDRAAGGPVLGAGARADAGRRSVLGRAGEWRDRVLHRPSCGLRRVV